MTAITAIAALLLSSAQVHAQGSPEERLLERLTTTIVNADYESTDFEVVVQDLRERFDLNIQVPWRHLESLGIRRDDRLDVVLDDVTLATLLRSIIRAADPTDKAMLSYQIDQSVIVIAPRDTMEAMTLLRAYDIADLIESGYADRRFFSTPGLALRLTGNETLGGEDRRIEQDQEGSRFGGGGGGFGGGLPPQRFATSEMERIEELIDLLSSLVTPEEWELNGGLTASIRARGSTLFIRHTIEGHQRIERFFEMLRDTEPVPLNAEAMIISLRADRVTSWKESIGSDFPRISSAQLDELLSDVEPSDVLFSGVSSGRNGNRFWFSALAQRDVLVSYDVATAHGINAFEPVSHWFTEGLELIALPRMTAGEDEMNVDIQMAWIPPARVSDRSVVLAPGAEPATIDQVSRSMRTVSTSVELSLGEVIVLSVPATLDTQESADDWDEFLIIRFDRVKRPASQEEASQE